MIRLTLEYCRNFEQEYTKYFLKARFSIYIYLTTETILNQENKTR